MNYGNGKAKYGNSGFTLIELLLVVPLIAVIFMLGYNILFLSHRSFSSVGRSMDVAEELRFFQTNIQKEANEAKKSEELKDALHRVSSTELYIYTDIDNSDGKNIPELVRYRLSEGCIMKDVKKPAGSEYPYTYTSPFGEAQRVLNNVANTDIFFQQQPIRIVDEYSQESKDYRMKLKMKLVIEAAPKDIEIQSYLVSKSRAEAE